MVQVQPAGMLPVRRVPPDIVFRQQPVAAAVGSDLVQRPMPVIGPRTFGSGQCEESHEGEGLGVEVVSVAGRKTAVVPVPIICSTIMLLMIGACNGSR